MGGIPYRVITCVQPYKWFGAPAPSALCGSAGRQATYAITIDGRRYKVTTCLSVAS